MKRVFYFVIESIFWFAIFLSPMLFFGIMAAIIYSNIKEIFWAVLVLLIGFMLGVLWAEHIRKKYGCSRYISKILSTPDIWPDESPEEK